MANQEMGAVAEQLREKMDQMDLESGEDSAEDAPIFTPELARLKAKEKGEKWESDGDEAEGSDEEMGEVKHYPDEFSDSEEEKEDYTIRRTDSLIVTATAENDHSNLEVYIYEHEKSNLYVHHEIILGAYPLCLEWMPNWMQKKANMIAVGTFLPEIEIWNLDSEACDPVAVLGSIEMSEAAKNQTVSKYKKHKQPSIAFSEETHTDAIMSLSLNPFQLEYLASGSADNTVRIWDLDEVECKATYKDLHSDKVQVVKWNSINE